MDTETKDGACCNKSKCCGKALIAAALLAVGGVGGYAVAKCCSKTAAPAAQTQTP